MYPYDNYEMKVLLVTKDTHFDSPVEEWRVVKTLARCNDWITLNLLSTMLAKHISQLTDDQAEFNIVSPNEIVKLRKSGLHRNYSSWKDLKVVALSTRTKIELSDLRDVAEYEIT